jgi:hypothetical protein
VRPEVSEKVTHELTHESPPRRVEWQPVVEEQPLRHPWAVIALSKTTMAALAGSLDATWEATA